MIECQIVSACETNIRGLAVDSNGNLTVEDWTAAGTNQYWQLSQGFDAEPMPLGVAIVNKATGTALHVPNNGESHQLDLVPANQLDKWSTWTFWGDRMVTGPWGNPLYSGKDAGYGAIRVFATDNLNLNVLGGCGNTGIGVWGWGDGERNEIWRVIPTGAGTPDYFNIKSACGGYLACDSGQQRAAIADGTDMSIAQWQLDIGFSGGGIFGAGAALGIAFRNVASNKSLSFDDHDTDNELLLADSGATWSFAPAGPFIPGAPRWVAIRRDADDTDYNLNVKHGCGNTEVTLYPWGDGQANEIWLLERA
jgi:hypothetical protein